MKRKVQFIATIIFFLLVNTSYYWEGNLGIFAMLTFLFMIVCFLVLKVLLLVQLYHSIREKFSDKQRIGLIGLMISILLLAFIYPNGLINFEKFESESLLIAQREGAANCMSTLKLKENNTFIERNVCFGVIETTGEYRFSGDTVYFENVSLSRHVNEFYEFAVITDKEQEEKNLGELVRYTNYSDTVGTPLWITKNEMKN